MGLYEMKASDSCATYQHGCDARLTHPAPCSRCSVKGVDCVVDIQFRRTPARERVSRLNHEIDSLKRSLEDAGLEKKSHIERPPSSGNLESDGSEPARGDTSIKEQEDGRPQSFCASSEMLLELQDDHIGDCALPREELIPLFST